MASTNKSSAVPAYNYEGARVPRLRPDQELRRSVLAALMWEDTFYESGQDHAKRVADLIQKVRPELVAALAVEAREAMYLRHIPLFLVRELARTKGNGRLVASTLQRVIQRPDEMGEYLALYWKANKDLPLSAGSKRGLAAAFGKFNEYALAKYDRDTEYKLRDVLRLVHPKPASPDQSAMWKRVVSRELETPDTWEVQLSGGGNKKEVFERLLKENKLGGLAFLRNLRNMAQSGVDENLIRNRLTNGNFDKVLPFRFISAARHVPRWEDAIEVAMLKCLEGQPKLAGTTALVIDTSPSMWGAKVSAKSELDRFDAAAALAILLREICENVHIWAFNSKAYEIPPRRGFALRDALAQTRGGYSCGGLAVEAANKRGYDRIIVLTDGEWHVMGASPTVDRWGFTRHSMGNAKEVSPAPLVEEAYMINVATYKNGVGYGAWHSIDGWSERIIDYIKLWENEAD